MTVIIPIGLILFGVLLIGAGVLEQQYLFRCLTVGGGLVYLGVFILRGPKKTSGK